MTETEWLAATDPVPMLTHLEPPPERKWNVSKRKLRLFSVGCCRRLHGGKLSAGERNATETAETYADVGMTVDDLAHANGLLGNDIRDGPVHCAMSVGIGAYVAYMVEQIVHTAGKDFSKRRFRWLLNRNAVRTAERAERQVLADLLRCVVGNPFRPVTFSPSWRTDTAVSLARTMYESRDFSVMPILADALQDAGCDNDDILDHCRGSGPHVRGCWVCDLVLGKE
jgi:hypothetical protein